MFCPHFSGQMIRHTRFHRLLLLYATPRCSAVRSASARSAASARSVATLCRAIVKCHSSMFSRSICQCLICCQCPICCHGVSCFCYMPLPYVQPFDLPVVDLLPFDLLRPDLLPFDLLRPDVSCCCSAYTCSTYPLSLDGGLPSFYTMTLSLLHLCLLLRTLGCGISDCP